VASTAVDLARDWLGSSVSDEEINAALDRFDGDPLLAARSILSRRLADFALIPGDLSVDQDYQRKITAQQIDLLDRRLDAVRAEAGDDAAESGLDQVTSATVTRCEDGPEEITANDVVEHRWLYRW